MRFSLVASELTQANIESYKIGNTNVKEDFRYSF
jgi:hypothetical protein